MTAKKRGMGKGVGALLGAPRPVREPRVDLSAVAESAKTHAAAKDAGRQVLYIALDRICSNRHQPRTHFDPDALQELVDSIKTQGILQPVLVRPSGDGYELLVGERRWRAARAAGLESVPAIVHEADDRQAQEWALLENLQREDLNPVEEARAYKALMDEHGLSQEEVAGRVGKNRASVANSLRLLKLQAFYLKDLEGGLISAGHARALLSLDNELRRKRLHDKIVKDGISVREAERIAQALNVAPEKGRRLAKSQPALDPEMRRLQNMLEDKLRTRVTLRPETKSRGRLEIRYNSLDEFDRIMEVLGVKGEL
ncbi:ParB/RepB/Spo0J family partition protein [Candidatus Sumerlaeota bacterium]|nr:ParB/RepB/Spo0J family partition protein [Candidatus Sumerlaeota bacterium]